MAEKTQLANAGKSQAELVVNNSFIDGLTQQLNEKCKYGLAFPEDYNVANSLMGAYLVLKETTDKNGKPILETCSQVSIANALMDMCVLGLNVQRKQGYFIAYGGKCQFQKSYFGNITIARRYGLKAINAEVVYADDDFAYHIDDGVKVLDKHVQKLENIDNTKIVGAYAVVTMMDGTKTLEVMNMAQIKQSWQQGYGYKEGSGTHSKFTDQMAKKTVINRALKGIINTHGDVFVQEADEHTEDIDQAEAIVSDVNYEIANEANTEELVVEEPKELPLREPTATVEATKASQARKAPSKAESAENELPGFMTMEDM